MKCLKMSEVNSTTYWGLPSYSLSHSSTVCCICICTLLWNSSWTDCIFFSNLSLFFFSFSFWAFTPDAVLLEFWLLVLTLMGKFDPFLRFMPMGAVLHCPCTIGGIYYLVRCRLLMYLFTELLVLACWFPLNRSLPSFVEPVALFVWDLSMLEFFWGLTVCIAWTAALYLWPKTLRFL